MVCIQKLLQDKRGIALLEFILVFPILIGLILGTINLAVLLNNNIVASSAARAAGRTVAVSGNVSEGVEKGKEVLSNGGLVSLEGDVDVNESGNRVEVEVAYKVPIIAPGFSVLLGGKPWEDEITLKAQSSYYAEYLNFR